MSNDGIMEYRHKIDALDQEIMSKVSERIELARSLGAMKAHMRLPVRNHARELEVIQSYREALGQLGLTIGNAIITECWQKQTGMVNSDQE